MWQNMAVIEIKYFADTNLMQTKARYDSSYNKLINTIMILSSDGYPGQTVETQVRLPVEQSNEGLHGLQII